MLTIGGNFPIVGFHAASQDFRDHLRQLAVEPSIDWIDCQSRKDVMNFYPFDPIAGHGIDVGAARRNPTIVPVRFREIIKPEHYNLFRWQFFRVHFQFVMANERPHAYDFFMIVCGPIPLRERMARPEAALAIATGDAAAREWAWKRLETRPPIRPDAADLGEMEPTSARAPRLKSGVPQPSSVHAPRPRRVGFDRRFGVKLGGYGLLKAACRRFLDGGKRFK